MVGTFVSHAPPSDWDRRHLAGHPPNPESCSAGCSSQPSALMVSTLGARSPYRLILEMKHSGCVTTRRVCADQVLTDLRKWWTHCARAHHPRTGTAGILPATHQTPNPGSAGCSSPPSALMVCTLGARTPYGLILEMSHSVAQHHGDAQAAVHAIGRSSEKSSTAGNSPAGRGACCISGC